MPFANTVTNTIPQVTEGEMWEGAGIALSTTSYENGLLIGRFAKWDTGRLDNLDGSATPVLAGVVARSVNDLVELPGQEASSLPFYASEPNVTFVRQGMITAKLAAGSATPVKFGAVFVVNQAANADNGNVTTVDDATTDATTAEFIEEIQSGIWLIRIK
jgi:hypothetical protein